MEWLKDKWKDFVADIKKAHKSLTVQLGVLIEIIIEYLPDIVQAVAEMEPYIMPDVYKRVMQGLVLAMILVRFRTTTALRNK